MIEDRIKAHLPIEKFLTQNSVPQTGSNEFKCISPDHTSDKPMAVHDPIFKCFSCGASGDVIDAHAFIHSCSREQSIASLSADLDLKDQSTTQVDDRRKFSELNYEWKTKFDEKKGDIVEFKVPLPWDEVIRNLISMGNERLFTLAGTMFALPDVPGDEPIILPRNSYMFEFLASSNSTSLDWANTSGCITKDEAYAGVLRRADSYISVEQVPHVPQMRGRLYNHPDLPMPRSSILEQFLDFFCPETDLDRILLKALFVTSIWGGYEGSRPMFVITSKDGQGVGKSKVAIILGELIGGYISSDTKKDIEDLKTRLLTPDARCKRMVFLDNEVGEVSSGEIASLITEKVISGRQLYRGDGSRPNTLMWVMTLNTPQLDRDLSTRSIPISLKRFDKDKSKTWERDIMEFVDEHRWTLISCFSEICEIGADYGYDPFTRFPLWETSILANCCADVDWEPLKSHIRDARERFNVEDEAILDFVDEFKDALRRQVEAFAGSTIPTRDMDTIKVVITTNATWSLAKDISGLKGLGKITATRRFREYIEKGLFGSQLEEFRNSRYRGFLWTGKDCRETDDIHAVWADYDVGLVRPVNHDQGDIQLGDDELPF